MLKRTSNLPQARLKAELLNKDGRQTVQALEENGAAECLVAESDHLVGFATGKDCRDDPGIDVKVEKMTRERLQGFRRWLSASDDGRIRYGSEFSEC